MARDTVIFETPSALAISAKVVAMNSSRLPIAKFPIFVELPNAVHGCA
jgi:hypothetical protein